MATFAGRGFGDDGRVGRPDERCFPNSPASIVLATSWIASMSGRAMRGSLASATSATNSANCSVLDSRFSTNIRRRLSWAYSALWFFACSLIEPKSLIDASQSDVERLAKPATAACKLATDNCKSSNLLASIYAALEGCSATFRAGEALISSSKTRSTVWRSFFGNDT